MISDSIADLKDEKTSDALHASCGDVRDKISHTHSSGNLLKWFLSSSMIDVGFCNKCLYIEREIGIFVFDFGLRGGGDRDNIV